jgi:DNA end-binding protein Ku
LRYAYEVRDDADYFAGIGDAKVGSDMLDLAAHIIDRKMSSFDPKTFKDRYQSAVLELIKAKSGHGPAPKHDAPPPSNVINLMDALRRSVAGDKDGAKDSASGGPKRAKTSRTAAKSAATAPTRRSGGAAKKGARKGVKKSAGGRLKKAS